MKERPILMSAPMVRATLRDVDPKTQTRRTIRMHRGDDSCVFVDHGKGWWPYRSEDGESMLMPDGCEHPYTCPYGVPGDRLWVRETFKVDLNTRFYRADEQKAGDLSTAIPWAPSIFMPRWASRITLEVTDVRVERLQDISQADAMAEGAPPSHHSIDVISRQYGYEDFSRSWYAQLWDQINGAGSWAANPWVWVVSFRRINAHVAD